MKTNIIFQEENIEICWYTSATRSEAKGVSVKVKATNPTDGKVYEKQAGWIGVSLGLHAGVKTPVYIQEAACILICKHKEEILSSIISFLEVNGYSTRASEFRKENCRAAGNGVNNKIAHPSGEGQRQRVRSLMQRNAPIGTNHL